MFGRVYAPVEQRLFSMSTCMRMPMQFTYCTCTCSAVACSINIYEILHVCFLIACMRISKHSTIIKQCKKQLYTNYILFETVSVGNSSLRFFVKTILKLNHVHNYTHAQCLYLFVSVVHLQSSNITGHMCLNLFVSGVLS
jgi:hypothetical protein